MLHVDWKFVLTEEKPSRANYADWLALLPLFCCCWYPLVDILSWVFHKALLFEWTEQRNYLLKNAEQLQASYTMKYVPWNFGVVTFFPQTLNLPPGGTFGAGAIVVAAGSIIGCWAPEGNDAYVAWNPMRPVYLPAVRTMYMAFLQFT